MLCLLQGRPEDQGVREAFGQPAPNTLVEVQSTSLGGAGVSGWAMLPPYGHANASRQYVYVNGRPVHAAPLCKTVDALFTSLYKSNARLVFGHDGELASSRKLGNSRAQFVLAIQCSPASYGVSPEPDCAEVHFGDWEPVLAAAKLAVLRAWRPVLTMACLKQLEQLEQAEAAAGGASHLGHGGMAAPAAGPAAVGFREWVASYDEDLHVAALLAGSRWPPLVEEPSSDLGSGRHSGRRAQRSSAGSGGSSRPPAVAGVKHTLTSRLVPFAGMRGGVGAAAPASGHLADAPSEQHSGGVPTAKRARADTWQPPATSPVLPSSPTTGPELLLASWQTAAQDGLGNAPRSPQQQLTWRQQYDKELYVSGRLPAGGWWASGIPAFAAMAVSYMHTFKGLLDNEVGALKRLLQSGR
jgi:hypothetical protein